MNRRTFSLAATGAVSLLTLAACGEQFGSSLPSYRYRLMVEVDTPTGLKTGSSVIEVRTSIAGDYSIPDPKSASRSYRGEAVAVDIAPGQTLFALLGGADTRMWAVVPPVSQKLLMANAQRYQYVFNKTLIDEILALKGAQPLPRETKFGADVISGYPMLVRFRDVRDPMTVEAVDPDHLDASFGAGVKLRRITVQITDDPVTSGIEKRFSWWNHHKNRHFDGTATVSEDMTTTVLAAHMASGDLSTEYNK
jgi:hypothetical protein